MSRFRMNMRRVAFASTLVALMSAGQAHAQGTSVYNSIPSPVPPNVPSLGYQATQTAEWGDHVALAGTQRRAASATVLMSNWAVNADYPLLPTAGYMHPITLNVYAVNQTGSNPPALGALLGTKTQSFLIPWRPAADPTCPGGTAWKAGNGNCYNGYAFTITFDLRSLVLTLPDQVIVGVAYNTNTWGYQPIGSPGPYESLNVGTANVGGVGVPPSVGTDVEPDATFWNTMTAAWYADNGAGGVGVFRRDTNWTNYAPAFQLSAYTLATTQDACKQNGWKTLSRADASSFKNQGDCIQYVNTGK